jgi:1-acyl-sn-glycerol-3-phosphate acyltransferase
LFFLRQLLFFLRVVIIVVVFFSSSTVMVVFFIMRPYDNRNNYLFCRLINFLLVKPLGLEFRLDRNAAIYDEQPVVCVLNHQGLLDIIISGEILPRKSCTLGKRSLGYIPIWGLIFRFGGNILVNRRDPVDRKKAMINLKRILVEKGASLWIFPEGTRNTERELLPFHEGAFSTAIQNNLPIQPIVISSYQNRVNLRRWKSVISIKVLPAVELNLTDNNDLEHYKEEIRHSMQITKNQLDTINSL